MDIKDELRESLITIRKNVESYRVAADAFSEAVKHYENALKHPLTRDEAITVAKTFGDTTGGVNGLKEIKLRGFSEPSHANNRLLNHYLKKTFSPDRPECPVAQAGVLVRDLNNFIKTYVKELFNALNATAEDPQSQLKGMYLKRDISRFELVLGEMNHYYPEGEIDWKEISIDRDYVLEDYTLEFLDKYGDFLNSVGDDVLLISLSSWMLNQKKHLVARLAFIERLESFDIFKVSA